MSYQDLLVMCFLFACSEVKHEHVSHITGLFKIPEQLWQQKLIKIYISSLSIFQEKKD